MQPTIKKRRANKIDHVSYGIISKLATTYLLLALSLIGLFISNVLTINQYNQMSTDTGIMREIFKNLQYADTSERTFLHWSQDSDYTNTTAFIDEAAKLLDSVPNNLKKAANFMNVTAFANDYRRINQEIMELTLNKKTTEEKLLSTSESSLDVIIRLNNFIDLQYASLLENEETPAEQIYTKINQMKMSNELYQSFLLIRVLERDFEKTGNNTYIQDISSILSGIHKGAEELSNSFDIMINKTQTQVIQDNIKEYKLALDQYEALQLSLIEKESHLNNLTQQVFRISTELDATNLLQQKSQKEKMVGLGLILISISFIIVGFSVLMLKISIEKPLTKLRRELKAATATNDLSKTIQFKNKDEIYYLANSFNHFTKHIREIIIKLQISSKEMNSHSIGFNHDSEGLNKYLVDISNNLDALTLGMNENAQIISSIQTTSEAIEASVILGSQQAIEQANQASQAHHQAKKIHKDIGESRIKSLDVLEITKKDLKVALKNAEVVHEISSLSDTIITIAQQTRLLSLNAAIEAARAGTAGDGFGVVANSIRRLSEETQQTISKIQTLTHNVIGSVDDLSKYSNKMIDYIDSDIHVTYTLLDDMSSHYMKDSKKFKEQFHLFEDTMGNVVSSVNQITTSIQDMNHSINAATIDISAITDEMLEIKQISNHVSNASKNVSDTSTVLATIAATFIIE